MRESHAGERARMMRPRTYSAQGEEPDGAPSGAAAPRPFPPPPFPPGKGEKSTATATSGANAGSKSLRHAGERARKVRPRTYSAQGEEPDGAPSGAAAPRPFPPAPVPPGNGGEIHSNYNDRSKCRVKVSAVGAPARPGALKDIRTPALHCAGSPDRQAQVLRGVLDEPEPLPQVPFCGGANV